MFYCTDFGSREFDNGVADMPLPFDQVQSSNYHLAVDGKTFAIIRDHFSDSVYEKVNRTVLGGGGEIICFHFLDLSYRYIIVLFDLL